MANIYESVKSNITNDMISKVATEIGENNSQISQAANSVIPALLAAVLKKGGSGKIQSVLEEVHKKNGSLNKEKLSEAYLDTDNINIGEKFISTVMGGDETSLISMVAGEQVMSNVNTRKLLSMIGTIVAGTLGKKLAGHGGNMPKLMEELNNEKTAILADIPGEWKTKFALTPAAVNYDTKKVSVKEEPKKKKNCWIWWALIILAVLLLIWMLRGCNSCNRVAKDEGKVAVVEQTALVAATNTDTRETYELSLPNGKTLIVYRNEMEDKIIKFLESDSYKNATDEELKNHWFEFNDIDFVFGSGVELEEGSKTQLDNLAAILAHYSDTKVKIGGFADKVGGEQGNMVLSEQRANTIKKMLHDSGIAENRVSTEGFGEECATIPADASNVERASDRDIALRFMK